jgi:ABC-2 type transport system permease protein
MQSIFLKDFRQFFTGLSGYLSIGLFLLLMGLFLFIFPDTSIFDYGYATMDKFFELAPWILLMLVPAITMRSLSDEFRTGTWELLRTRPLTLAAIVGGKYFAALMVGLLALLPSILYVFTIWRLSLTNSIDTGGIVGAYIGLVLLVCIFTAIGIFCSALTTNPIIGFLLGAFVCFIIFIGFRGIGSIPVFQGGADYILLQLGIEAHYQNMSRGVIEWPDLVYFIGVTGIFLLATTRILKKRQWGNY